MASQYGLLPSEVLDRATTFDLQVLDIAQSYREYLRKKHTGQLDTPNVNPNKLQDLLEQFKLENRDARSIQR